MFIEVVSWHLRKRRIKNEARGHSYGEKKLFKDAVGNYKNNYVSSTDVPPKDAGVGESSCIFWSEFINYSAKFSNAQVLFSHNLLLFMNEVVWTSVLLKITVCSSSTLLIDPLHTDMLHDVISKNVLRRNVEMPYSKWIIREISYSWKYQIETITH